MLVKLYDGRSIDVPTDDADKAKLIAARWAKENPQVERGAQLGEEDVSTLGDIARGVGAGLVGAAEGIVSLPAQLTDLATDPEESNAEAVREFFGQFKPTTSTTLGEAAKFITQFAVPGGAAAKAAKAAQLGRAGQIGSFAAADFAATTPDVETLGDFFDGGPTKRLDTSELEGAERAAAELGNRLKVAGEGATLLLGFAALYVFNSRVIFSSQASSCSFGRALSAGKEPMIPALHCSITNSGPETIYIGDPINGNLS